MTVSAHPMTKSSSEAFPLVVNHRVAEGAVAGAEQRPLEAGPVHLDSSSSLLPTTAEAERLDLGLPGRALSRRAAALVEAPVTPPVAARTRVLAVVVGAVVAGVVPAPPRVVARREIPKAPKAVWVKMTPRRASADTTISMRH